MKKPVSWKGKTADGVRRDVRVTIIGRGMKWQFKRAGMKEWDYDSEPTSADWDTLEDILKRRAGRGRAVVKLETVQKQRAAKGV